MELIFRIVNIICVAVSLSPSGSAALPGPDHAGGLRGWSTYPHYPQCELFEKLARGSPATHKSANHSRSSERVRASVAELRSRHGRMYGFSLMHRKGASGRLCVRIIRCRMQCRFLCDRFPFVGLYAACGMNCMSRVLRRQRLGSSSCDRIWYHSQASYLPQHHPSRCCFLSSFRLKRRMCLHSPGY